ncbi:hypothetical protein BH10PSE19_BH10PSE19_16210 [soil metagenome]
MENLATEVRSIEDIQTIKIAKIIKARPFWANLGLMMMCLAICLPFAKVKCLLYLIGGVLNIPSASIYLYHSSCKIMKNKILFIIFNSILVLSALFIWPLAKSTASYAIFSTTHIEGENFPYTHEFVSDIEFVLLWTEISALFLFVFGIGFQIYDCLVLCYKGKNKQNFNFYDIKNLSLYKILVNMQNSVPTLSVVAACMTLTIILTVLVGFSDKNINYHSNFIKELMVDNDFVSNYFCNNIQQGLKIKSLSYGVNVGKVMLANKDYNNKYSFAITTCSL